jgi:phosphate ABC transporter phosphate-binding protein
LGVIASMAAVTAAPAEAASPVTGAGSTFAQIAIDQWRRDVSRTQGIQVTYSGQGSSQGRRQFISGTVDFASSDIAFEPTELPVPRPFTYAPLVAGGTALMYNLKDGAGRQITNLQLSGPTIARIFTGAIRRWDAAEIKADNPGIANRLPAEDIKPVVRSGGSGTSAVFTGYMAKIAPDVWGSFSSQYGINADFTSTFPDVPGFIKQSGSDGIANFVANPNAGRGSIGYAEAGYAKQRGLPQAYVRNASGNWTQPTARAVAIALTQAQRNGDGTQNLNGVYGHTHPESYAISSYNYLIVPTGGLDAGKGETLGKFVIYSVTEGQAKAAQLGYSPLPPNLVQQALDVVKQIPGAPAPPPLGDYGKYYEQLAVSAPPKQPTSPQGQGGSGGSGGGGGGGSGGSGGSSGAGSSSSGGSSASATGADAGAGTAGSDPALAEGGDALAADGELSPEEAALLEEEGAAGSVGGFRVDESGRLITESGSSPELPSSSAFTVLLFAAGAAIIAVVIGPPALASRRTRVDDPVVAPSSVSAGAPPPPLPPPPPAPTAAPAPTYSGAPPPPDRG